MAGGYVPKELMEEILSRVPPKSLVRFKTVSKKCYSLLSQDDKFAKFHLKQQCRNHRPLRFFQVYPLGGTIFQSFDPDDYDDTNNAPSRKFHFPVQLKCQIQLIGSANGLICVALCKHKDCFIWNPCTRESKRISVPVPDASFSVSGFGYDSCSDDYKIVAHWDGKFRRFSLKTKSWKIFDYAFPVQSNAFHFNGALYWCLDTNVAVFDLAKEQLFYIDIPDQLNLRNDDFWFLDRCFVSLLDYQGLLCISGGESRWAGHCIWALNKYDWVKLTAVLEHPSPVGISKLGQVVYQGKAGSGFVKSHIHTRMSKDDRSRTASLCQSPHLYTASLISPRCFDCPHPQPESTRPRKRRRKSSAT